jgi:hypothetical protein
VVRSVLLEQPSRLRTHAGRSAALCDIVRTAAQRDFEQIHDSPQWRTYLALTLTAVSLSASELRNKVQEALARSERRFVEHIATTFRTTCGLLGLRPRPPLTTWRSPRSATRSCAVSSASLWRVYPVNGVSGGSVQ